jgi:hypothetical protein
MEKTYQPSIVVAAYNRPNSLARILRSLNNAKFINDTSLIISIDNDYPQNLQVKEIADHFSWSYGTKEVRYQEIHLGLRNHILQCGDLALEYGSVIILEDDLYVSPFFYEYAVHALNYYSTDKIIAGISLYNQPIQEIVRYPFTAIYDNSDVYFLQFPSSLGQAWTSEQWKGFRNWYDAEPDLSRINMPAYIKRWPESSWKKYFAAYVVAKNKFFVFPNYSFTTNFNDSGTNRTRRVNHDGQTPLKLSGQPYRFKEISSSNNLYDVNLEILPECIKHFNQSFNDYSYVLDLYGTKDLDSVKTPYVITSRPTANAIKGFARALKPHEMNIIFNLEGSDFFLSKLEDVLPFGNYYERKIRDYRYFYTVENIGWKAQASIYIDRLRRFFFPQDK